MKKKIVFILLIVSAFVFGNLPTKAQEPFFSYTYDYWGEPVPAPHAFLPSGRIDGLTLGIDHFSNPRDLFVADDGRLFIADTGNNRIVTLGNDLKSVEILESFETPDGTQTLNQPEGVFVTKEGELYIADTGNSRIIHLDNEGKYVRTIGRPEADIIPPDFVFSPVKLAVDNAGRIYVIATGVTQGIMMLDAYGIFRGFMGASRVTPGVMDIFWRAVATEAQRERMLLFVPTEYNNIAIDDEGFLYVTTDKLSYWDILHAVNARSRDDRVAPVRKLNPTGVDVLRREGFFPPIGDVEFDYMEQSQLVDVSVSDYGIYSVLDRRQGRIFTYDPDGNLLFVFGGLGGARLGTFRNPVAIERIGNQILVLDSMRASITLFDITEYGKLLKDAVVLHRTGDYEASTEKWREVLRRNSNSDLAYIGMGMAYMRKDDFSTALDHFRIGAMRERFSRAFQLYRREVIGRNFGLIALMLLVLFVTFVLIRRRNGKLTGKRPQYD